MRETQHRSRISVPRAISLCAALGAQLIAPTLLAVVLAAESRAWTDACVGAENCPPFDFCSDNINCDTHADCESGTLCVPFGMGGVDGCFPSTCVCDSGRWVCSADCASQCVARAPFPSFSAVVPNENTHREGAAGSPIPLGNGLTGHPQVRYQQIYESSEFWFHTTPLDVFALAFRPHSIDGSGFSPTVIPSVEIYLSTTTYSQDALSSTFADNVGADQALVFSGDLEVSSSATGSAPHEFDIVIDLQVPFIYDPSAGNLLLEIRNPSSAVTTYFDSVNQIGDGVSRIASVSSSTDPTASVFDAWALVTEFRLSYVPVSDEVSSLAICLALVAGLARLVAHRRRSG